MPFKWMNGIVTADVRPLDALDSSLVRFTSSIRLLTQLLFDKTYSNAWRVYLFPLLFSSSHFSFGWRFAFN